MARIGPGQACLGSGQNTAGAGVPGKWPEYSRGRHAWEVARIWPGQACLGSGQNTARAGSICSVCVVCVWCVCGVCVVCLGVCVGVCAGKLCHIFFEYLSII